MNINDKKNALIEYFKKFKKVAIAYSGGTDSSLLIMVAKESLGAQNVLAITANSPLIPNREFEESKQFCLTQSIKHLSIDANVLDVDEIKNNATNRCYVCKYTMLKGLIFIANKNGIYDICEGSNADDLNDYRPGFKAVKELNIKSPLLELGITKNEVRQMLKEYGLSIYNKPSFACLASRFVYGETISKSKLDMLDKAEQYLFDLGYNQFRVRVHNNLARIEVNQQDFDKILNEKDSVVTNFKEFGFDYVTLDLQGYRIGSMNEVL